MAHSVVAVAWTEEIWKLRVQKMEEVGPIRLGEVDDVEIFHQLWRVTVLNLVH